MGRSGYEMGFASLTTAAFAVLAACTAIYNFWLYFVRPKEVAHLWLSISAAGVVWVGVGVSMLYAAQDVESARAAHITAINGAPLIVIGFLRFTSVFLSVRIRTAEWCAGVFTVVFISLVNLQPDWFFTGEAILARTEWFGESHIEERFRPTIALLLPGFGVMFCAVIYLFARHRSRVENPKFIIGSILLWTATGFNDITVAVGGLQGPYLVSLGFFGFAMSFTGMLLTRFVSSAERLEEDTDALQTLVVQRTHELRDRDLQLTHGARMATVGAIAAGLAEEIRAPATTAARNLRALPAAFKGPGLQLQYEELLDDARNAVDQIRVVVSDLLRIARRDGDAETEVSLVQAIESVVPIAHGHARGRARIVTELAPVPMISGSETLLSQIVLDLIVHAIHRAPEGAGALGNDPVVTLRTSYQDSSVWLSVEDEGPGIDEEELASLIDPFILSSSRHERGRLGLAVTHQLIERHRGSISVENGSVSTRFLVEFPMATGVGTQTDPSTT